MKIFIHSVIYSYNLPQNERLEILLSIQFLIRILLTEMIMTLKSNKYQSYSSIDWFVINANGAYYYKKSI